MKDPYVYEGTNVLKNKLDIKDEATLEKAESDFVGLAANRLRHSDFVIEKDFKIAEILQSVGSALFFCTTKKSCDCGMNGTFAKLKKTNFLL